MKSTKQSQSLGQGILKFLSMLVIISARIAHAGPIAKNPGSAVRSAGIEAVGGIFRAVSPQWQTAIGNFLNSPSYTATDFSKVILSLPKPAAQEIERTRLDYGARQQGFATMQELVESKAAEFVRKLNNPTPEETIALAKKVAEVNAIVAPYLSERERERQNKLTEKMERMAEALGRGISGSGISDTEAVTTYGSTPFWQRILPASWRLQRSTSRGQKQDASTKTGVPAPNGPESKTNRALQVNDNVRSAWASTIAEVEKAASQSRDNSATSGVPVLLKHGIDKIIVDFTEASKTASRTRANEMSRKLDWFISGGRLTTEQGRRIRNLKIALDDYDAGRTNAVLIDPVTVKDNISESLGLAESNVTLQANVTEVFTSQTGQVLSRLDAAEQLAMLRSLARTAGWGSDLKVPSSLQQKLVANNEWSIFAGNVSAYAIDGLAKIGTAEALAEVALQATTSVRISEEQYFVLSNKALHILKSADPGIVREAIGIAQQSLKYPPYNSDSWHAQELAKKLSELKKMRQSRIG